MTTIAEEIKSRINERAKELVRRNESNEYMPFVCVVCDHLLRRSDVCCLSESVLRRSSTLLTPQDWNAVGNERLEECYKYPRRANGYKSYMKKMMLSPRGGFVKSKNGNKGYTSCKSCQNALRRNIMPLFAIANNNYAGEAPKELLELNAVELAFLTPIKTHGYTFTWSGGKACNLKGSLAYYKVNEDSIAKGVGQLWSLGANIVILMHGKMTKMQRKKARENSSIRVNKLVDSLEWLKRNNIHWKGTDVVEWKRRFEKHKPIVIDKSEQENDSEEPDASNVEVTEKFCVYYPDGTYNEYNAGEHSSRDFKDIVHNAKKHGFDLEWKCRLERDLVGDITADSTFMMANLLQFPFGRGGFNEQRMSKNGKKVVSVVNTEEFVRHLASMSIREFHRPLFCLIIYNLTFKATMLRTASLTVENGKIASTIVDGLNDADDLQRAGIAHNRGSFGGTTASRKYLKYVRNVAGSLPHSNESSGKAQMKMEAMCHNLGAPQVFLTITPDDDNSFLLQAFSACYIDGDSTSVDILSDEDLRKKATARTTLRLKYPGISALVFEEVLEVIMEEAVGWDCKENRPNGKTGLFGSCFACTYVVEEQGRKSLHAHIMLWIRELKTLFKRLDSNLNKERETIASKIADRFDTVASTGLIPTCTATKRKLQIATDHKCEVVNKKQRMLPKLVPEQQLRNLRHKDGFRSVRGVFATCPHCTAGQFTNEQLIERYLIEGEQIKGLNKYPDPGTRRLHAMFVEHQKPGSEDLDPIVIRAAYNNHLSCHLPTCFRCNKKRKRKGRGEKDNSRAGRDLCPEDVECRLRLPDLPRKRSKLEESDTRYSYSYDGARQKKHFYKMKVKRNQYDVFQNVSCFPVSESKIGIGNSNVSFLFPGPILPYICKYQMKTINSTN